MEGKELQFDSKAIHGGQMPDAAYGAVMPPIYQTSTFARTPEGEHKGFIYSRAGNPTRTALENSLTSLENGYASYAFASGVAAIDAVIRTLSPGDEVLVTQDLYGGSYRLFKQVFEPLGIWFRLVDMQNADTLEAHIHGGTKMVWVETPTNPLMQILDLEAIARITKKHRLPLAVDNTFATPYLQRPLDLGADLSIHSATKYLGGHSDVIAGLVVVKDAEWAKKIYAVQTACGAICGPMDSYLVLRGIKTLHLRMQRHSENAGVVARFLAGHPMVDKVYWPGFSDHPNHAIAKRQMTEFGGMVSLEVKGGLEPAMRMLRELRLFTLADSLGGVESLVGHPARMSHAGMPREERLKIGVSDGLIRLSVGIEDADDLVGDLDQALSVL